MRKTTVTLAVFAAIGLAAPSAPVAAQDNRAAARDLVKKWQEAVVNVRVVLKMRMSMGGREMQASDDPVDTVGTVIDPSGLTVLSLGSLNPGGMMSKLMGSMGGGGGQPSVEITTEPTDVKIRLSNGRELPAKIVLRDEDLDLAFLRPTTKPETPLVALDLTDAAKPALLDQVLVLVAAGARRWVDGAVPRCTTSARSSRSRAPSTCSRAPRRAWGLRPSCRTAASSGCSRFARSSPVAPAWRR